MNKRTRSPARNGVVVSGATSDRVSTARGAVGSIEGPIGGDTSGPATVTTKGCAAGAAEGGTTGPATGPAIGGSAGEDCPKGIEDCPKGITVAAFTIAADVPSAAVAGGADADAGPGEGSAAGPDEVSTACPAKGSTEGAEGRCVELVAEPFFEGLGESLVAVPFVAFVAPGVPRGAFFAPIAGRRADVGPAPPGRAAGVFGTGPAPARTASQISRQSSQRTRAAHVGSYSFVPGVIFSSR